MASAPSGSHGHRIMYLMPDCYRLSWRTYHKNSGSRLLLSRAASRDTDRAGAERFARRWGCEMPKDPR